MRFIDTNITSKIGMKILLIRPPVENQINTPVPNYITKNQGIYPPLGLMYLASSLEKYFERNVFILDCELENLNYEQIKEKIKKIEPDVVGIQAITFGLVDALIVANLVKEIDPEIKVVFGGRHVDLFSSEMLSYKCIDFIVLGEGEITFPKLVENLGRKGKLKKIKGIGFRNEGKGFITGQANIIKNLDALPFPARNLTDYKKYKSIFSPGKVSTTVMSSRGCPYSCIFCDNRWKKFRSRSVKNIVDEIEECVALGIEDFFFFDDTFTMDKERVYKICREIKQRRLKISFAVRSRIDLINEKMLRTLNDAGCERIQYGLESSSQRILDIIQKGIRIEQIEKNIRISKKAGLITYADFMIGLPEESKKDILKTIEFAKKLDLDYAQFSITLPLPGTKLYEMGIKKGLFEDFWKAFAKNPRKDFGIKYWEENISEDELVHLLNFAYKSFYFRPSYALKRILKLKSIHELQTNLSVAFKMYRKL